MVGAKALRQQGFQPFAKIALVDAEHLAGRGIDKFDPRFAADADDAVIGGVDHSFKTAAAGGERIFQLLLGGDVDGGDDDPVDPCLFGNDGGEDKAPPAGAGQGIDGQLALHPGLLAHALVHRLLDAAGDVAGKHFVEPFANAAKHLDLEGLGEGVVG